MVSYSDRTDIIYLRDLLQYYKAPQYYSFPKDSVLHLASLPADPLPIVATAKTLQNSLLLRAEPSDASRKVHRLSLQQFIPLPDLELGLKTVSHSENAFEEMRTPIFLIVFIGVLLVQIFYRQKKQKAEEEKALAGMGPLEKSLRGRAPNGKPLSEKQLREVQDIDRMLGDMGKFGADADGGMAGLGGGSSAPSKSKNYG